MKIKDILRHKGPKVWAVKADQKIHDALQLMVNQKIGALLVFDNRGNIAGIISERDIVRGCYLSSQAINHTPVSELMTRKVITASPDDNINEIMGVMTENRVRHIPVVAGGQLEGLISIGDVVKALLEDSAHQIRFLKEYMHGSE